MALGVPLCPAAASVGIAGPRRLRFRRCRERIPPRFSGSPASSFDPAHARPCARCRGAASSSTVRASPSTRRSAAAQARCRCARWKSARLPQADRLNRSGLKRAGSKIGTAPVARSAIGWPTPGPTPKPCPEEPEARMKPGTVRRHAGDDSQRRRHRHRDGRLEPRWEPRPLGRSKASDRGLTAGVRFAAASAVDRRRWAYSRIPSSRSRSPLRPALARRAAIRGTAAIELQRGGFATPTTASSPREFNVPTQSGRRSTRFNCLEPVIGAAAPLPTDRGRQLGAE